MRRISRRLHKRRDRNTGDRKRSSAIDKSKPNARAKKGEQNQALHKIRWSSSPLVSSVSNFNRSFAISQRKLYLNRICTLHNPFANQSWFRNFHCKHRSRAVSLLRVAGRCERWSLISLPNTKNCNGKQGESEREKCIKNRINDRER